MKVSIENWGWHCGHSGTFFTPWYSYLCKAANGIITWVHTTQYIQTGEYELSDEEWSLDNPRWDDEKCEEVIELV